jgi:hypothetical protein
MKVEFVNELVTAETVAHRDGTGRPLAFVWRGRRFPIEAWGRESTKTSGDRTRHCYLVQTAGPETWELCQDQETAQWTLVRHWASKDPIA